MSKVTDYEHQLIITTYFDQIDNAVRAARTQMALGAGGRPEVVDHMFELIGQLAKRGQQFRWPDPAKLALTARQDPAVQKLLKRTSKSTPIRAAAGKTAKVAKTGGAS